MIEILALVPTNVIDEKNITINFNIILLRNNISLTNCFEILKYRNLIQPVYSGPCQTCMLRNRCLTQS